MTTRVRRRFNLARRPVRLSARDASLLELVLDGLRDFNGIISESTPASSLLRLDGLVAAVTPAAPEQPIVNAVVFERPDALAAGLERLAAAYAQAGVRRWMVLVPATDGQAKRLLKKAGHVRVGNEVALARGLTGSRRPAEGELEEWTADGDPQALAAVCDSAFRAGGSLARAFPRPPDRARLYLASLEGQPASCIMAAHHGGNCAVDLVATIPEAQRRGLSSRLLGHVLADAEEHGCVTSTVVSSAAGESTYRHAGYRPVGRIQHWTRSI